MLGVMAGAYSAHERSSIAASASLSVVNYRGVTVSSNRCTHIGDGCLVHRSAE